MLVAELGDKIAIFFAKARFGFKQGLRCNKIMNQLRVGDRVFVSESGWGHRVTYLCTQAFGTSRAIWLTIGRLVSDTRSVVRFLDVVRRGLSAGRCVILGA